MNSHPWTLNLDIDVVRSMIGGWLDEPHEAGVRARSLSLAMASEQLSTERDVIVPQFLGRAGFIDELAAVASACGAAFIEAALWVGRADAISAFGERCRAPVTQSHHDAAALVRRSTSADPIGEMYDAFVELVEARPQTRLVNVVPGNIDLTFKGLVDTLDNAAP